MQSTVYEMQFWAHKRKLRHNNFSTKQQVKQNTANLKKNETKKHSEKNANIDDS